MKMLGNGRLEALCFDGSKRLANVSDTKKKKKLPLTRNDPRSNVTIRPEHVTS